MRRSEGTPPYKTTETRPMLCRGVDTLYTGEYNIK